MIRSPTGRHVVHTAVSFRFPSRGVICGTKSYWQVTKDPKSVTCAKCKKAGSHG